MLLAELEVFQSRPIARTRRLALGRRELPVAPAPGFGGLLLGAITATFIERVETDEHAGLLRLTHDVEQGRRIPQPRARHRFQTDHIGLNRRTHRLFGDGEELRLAVDEGPGTAAEPQVLAAIYAAGELPWASRGPVMELIRRGLKWRGAADHTLVEFLTGRTSAGGWIAAGAADPVTWALAILGLEGSNGGRPTVQRAFRDALRDAHPDLGGAQDDAARRIADLTEARRILLAS